MKISISTIKTHIRNTWNGAKEVASDAKVKVIAAKDWSVTKVQNVWIAIKASSTNIKDNTYVGKYVITHLNKNDFLKMGCGLAGAVATAKLAVIYFGMAALPIAGLAGSLIFLGTVWSVNNRIMRKHNEEMWAVLETLRKNIHSFVQNDYAHLNAKNPHEQIAKIISHVHYHYIEDEMKELKKNYERFVNKDVKDTENDEEFFNNQKKRIITDIKTIQLKLCPYKKSGGKKEGAPPNPLLEPEPAADPKLEKADNPVPNPGQAHDPKPDKKPVDDVKPNPAPGPAADPKPETPKKNPHPVPAPVNDPQPAQKTDPKTADGAKPNPATNPGPVSDPKPETPKKNPPQPVPAPLIDPQPATKPDPKPADDAKPNPAPAPDPKPESPKKVLPPPPAPVNEPKPAPGPKIEPKGVTIVIEKIENSAAK